MKPRLTHVLADLKLAGAEVHVLSLLSRLCNEFESSVVCLRGTGPLADDFRKLDIPVEVIRFKNRWSPVSLFKLASYFKRNQTDIVHTHLYPQGISGTAGARLAGVPVVVSTVHDMRPWGGKSSRERTDRALQRWRDAVVCVSNPVREVYRQTTGCDLDKCRVIPNGLDLTRFDSPPPRKEVLRGLGIPEENQVVGVVANLVPVKNLTGFLQVAAGIAQKRTDVTFLLVGEGPERAKLEALAETLGITQQVMLIGARRDIPDLLSVMDCFLLPSLREAFPISVLEAMAAGAPVVASQEGGLVDLIRSPEEGILVDPTDVSSMTGAVLEILEHAPRAETLRVNGARRVRSYGIDTTAETTASLYRELLEASDRRRAATRAAGWG